MLALNFSNNTTAWAGPGHDHGEEHDNAQAQATPDVAMGNSPRRLPTGEVFLPKPAQRQLNVRTTPAVLQAHAKVIELNGKVVVDPQTGGLVQTTTGGRFEAPPKGIPHIGQKVTKGELLGYVLASHGTLERSAQQAELAQLKSQLNLAESRLQRVQQLQDTLPRKELDAANAEVQGLKGQVAALAGGIGAKEALRAPASGVVSSSQAISGKVFDAGALVFEVLDPSVVRIDATWASGGVPPGFSGATVVLGDQTIQLNYVGAAGAVRDQSLTLVFEKLNGVVAHPFFAGHCFIEPCKLSHLLFDGFQVFWGERTFIGEIVEKTVFDHGANGDLRGGKQFLDSVGQQVSRGMTNHVQALFVLFSDDGQRCIIFNGVGSVYQRAIHRACQSSLGQTGANTGGHLGHSHGVIENAFGSVRQADYWHMHFPYNELSLNNTVHNPLF